jgi:hypothetical protein
MDPGTCVFLGGCVGLCGYIWRSDVVEVLGGTRESHEVHRFIHHSSLIKLTRALPPIQQPQVRALQLKFPNVIMDLFTAGHKVKFSDNPESIFLGTVAVETPFGTIHFAVMLINTPFLLYLADMDCCGVYFNNINNILVHNGKKHLIVRKWEHSWFFLDGAKTTAVHCYFTETELRQLYRRFGYPAAERFCRVLARAGYKNVNEFVMAKIGKYCHYC